MILKAASQLVYKPELVHMRDSSELWSTQTFTHRYIYLHLSNINGHGGNDIRYRQHR